MTLLNFSGSPHGGRLRLLPEWQSQPRITPTTILDHSIVGSAEGAYNLFKDRSGLESHFIVDLNGEIWQLMDTDREADANLEANAYAISIETADNGDPDTFKWTQEQLDSLKWLHEELRRVHLTIPRRRVTSCRSGGLGYHTILGAPSCFTPVTKTCPGLIRKQQWEDILLPAYLDPTQEVDMTPEESAMLKWLHDNFKFGHALQNTPLDNLFGNADRTHDGLIAIGTTSVKQAYDLLFARVRSINEIVSGVPAALEVLDDETAQRVVEILDARTPLPNTGLTKEDVKLALREVFADAATPDA